MCKTDRPQNVLINLNEHVGPHAEAKCLSINPVRPELLAVGANDPYVRLYDRRMLHCHGITFPADTQARYHHVQNVAVEIRALAFLLVSEYIWKVWFNSQASDLNSPLRAMHTCKCKLQIFL